MDYGFCKIRLVRYSGGTAGELHPFPYYPRSTAAAVRGTSSFSLIPAGCLTYKTSVSAAGKIPVLPGMPHRGRVFHCITSYYIRLPPMPQSFL